MLKPDAGVTITMAGAFDAGLWQGFDTSAGGAIAGLRFARPEWWGAKPDGVADCAAELQAATACVDNASGGLVQLVAEDYVASAGVTINEGAVRIVGLKHVERPES